MSERLAQDLADRINWADVRIYSPLGEVDWEDPDNVGRA